MSEAGRSPDRSAFSLIELVIVIVIISITAAIAVPRFSGSMSNYRVESAARRLSADIEHMRARARATSSARTIVIDVANDAYTVTGEGVDGATDYTVDLGTSPYDAAIVGADMGGTAKIAIDAYGMVSATGRVVLRSGGASRTVFVGSGEEVVEVGELASPSKLLDLGGGKTALLD